MAEGFGAIYNHVPQQSRRDKLRFSTHQEDQNLIFPSSHTTTFVPLYHHSSPDFINQTIRTHATAAKDEEGMINLMGSSSPSPSTNHMFLDPQNLNPTTIQHINHTPFSYAPHNLLLDQSFHHPTQVQQLLCSKPNNTSGQSLSLSLSSHNNNNLPLELNLQRYKVSEGYLLAGNAANSTCTELSRNSVPLGPFTGYASVLKGSRFLKPAHQLLEDICDVVGRGIFADNSSLLEPPLPSLSGNGVDDYSVINCSTDGGEQNKKKSRLLSMLDEVYKRYRQYYQQMHAVFTSFESVAGLSSAAPFANLAIKAMFKHFKSLKIAITDQLHFVSKSHGKINYERDETQGLEDLGTRNCDQRLFHIDQPVWRPQRGLPERAVTVLRSWLFEHFLHPYPTDTDKLMLAKQTGLSRNQVSNWFINARVRLWKPMVEEIHTLETRQSQKVSHREEFASNRITGHLPTSCSIDCENTSSSIQRNGDVSLKRTRKDLAEAHTEREEAINLPFNNLSHAPRLGNASNAGTSGGVSLTLGLHQNGVGISESYPITAARRFGLDVQAAGFSLGGFAAHNRQLAREVMGSQIMHPFQETDH